MRTTLELTPTAELIEELAKRFDVLVFNAMNRRTMETDAGPISSVRAWRLKGDVDLCVSLSAVIHDMALEGLRRQSTELDPGEL
ncbi:MAG: hypothetical protein Q7R68_10855 [Nitrospirales bacterium]|nr:hypothetical protein [Nitrospirales bacterium]